MNVLMIDGKKNLFAERIVYGALEQIEKKPAKVAIKYLTKPLPNAKPIVGSEKKAAVWVVQTTKFLLKFVLHVVWPLAMRWVRDAARKRGEIYGPAFGG